MRPTTTVEEHEAELARLEKARKKKIAHLMANHLELTGEAVICLKVAIRTLARDIRREQGNIRRAKERAAARLFKKKRPK